MQTLKAVLIDDERNSLESLNLELLSYCPEIIITAMFRDPIEGRQAILQSPPDVLFLDIEMPGMNGFDLLLSIPSINFEIIFVTAFDQFALKAFDVHAIDYLLKPIRKDKLIQAVQRAKERHLEKTAKTNVQAFVQHMMSQASYDHDQIALPTNEGFTFVKTKEIIYLEAESNYTWIKLTSQARLLISKSLGEIEGQLNASNFYRIHKTFVANIHQIHRYVRGQGGTLVMNDGSQIPVSRTHKEQLLKLILKGTLDPK